ncbi:YebC/PmpR family DNA-binding transcriptional regulator [bacterium]|nr:YebC/PmpR family DNA-binding transcriptional regulator [bacterium]
MTEADLHYFADNTVTLEGHDLEVFNNLLDKLNDNDDVDHVYHNVNLE